jgi:hypothetical protein
MKLLRLKKQISGFVLLLSTVFFSCTHSDVSVIKKMNIIPPKNYEGFVVIFHQQKTTKGRMEFKDGEHFFYIPEDGVVFTPCKLAHIVEDVVWDANGNKQKIYKTYQELKDNEMCIGCDGGRGGMEDTLGKSIVVTTDKFGLKSRLKKMKYLLYNPDLQDIYYGRKTGEIKYWHFTAKDSINYTN